MAVPNLKTLQPQVPLWLMLVGSLLPSGKRLHTYGKSPFLMGKSTISMAIFAFCMFTRPGGAFLNGPCHPSEFFAESLSDAVLLGRMPTTARGSDVRCPLLNQDTVNINEHWDFTR